MKLAVDGMPHQSCVSFFMWGFQGSQISCTCWWLDLEFISKSTGNDNLFIHRCLRTQCLRQEMCQICFVISQIDQFFRRGTSRPSTSRLIGLAVLLRSVLVVPLIVSSLYLSNNINSVIFRACFQHCLHVIIGEISEGHSSIRLSKSYYQCLSIDHKKRWCGMKLNCLRTVDVFCHYISQFRLVSGA